MPSWMSGCKPTRYPGIFKTQTGYRIRVRAVDSRTGTQKEANREYDGVEVKEALIKQQELREEIERGANTSERLRVGDYAKFWIESKAPTIDEATAKRYVEALEQHALPSLGGYFFDVVKSMDVQRWVNQELRKGYAVPTVHGWFRVFRTMARDAVQHLELPRDPTLRVTFPEAAEKEEANALTPAQLALVLDAMRELYPQHLALLTTLAFTGLRFCHASAIRWEDVDEEAAVIRIRRKHRRGVVGSLSRKKRAPREYPLHPALAAILKDHRRQLIERQALGVESGWVFPSKKGTLRNPGGLTKAWQTCLKTAGVNGRCTIHGLRRTFNDLSRLAGVDAVVTRSLTGHVTEKMREHYSTVRLDEKRAAVAEVVKLVLTAGSGDRSGDTAHASAGDAPTEKVDERASS